MRRPASGGDRLALGRRGAERTSSVLRDERRSGGERVREPFAAAAAWRLSASADAPRNPVIADDRCFGPQAPSAVADSRRWIAVSAAGRSAP